MYLHVCFYKRENEQIATEAEEIRQIEGASRLLEEDLRKNCKKKEKGDTEEISRKKNLLEEKQVCI